MAPKYQYYIMVANENALVQCLKMRFKRWQRLLCEKFLAHSLSSSLQIFVHFNMNSILRCYYPTSTYLPLLRSFRKGGNVRVCVRRSHVSYYWSEVLARYANSVRMLTSPNFEWRRGGMRGFSLHKYRRIQFRTFVLRASWFVVLVFFFFCTYNLSLTALYSSIAHVQ